MLSMYTSYQCVPCKKQFVLLTEETLNMSKDKYVACPYCNSRRIRKQNANDSLRECMKESSYKRINGSVRQVR